MNPVPLDPFDDDPFGHDPFERDSFERKSMERFERSMDPFWAMLHRSLKGQQPESWSGYRCEIDVVWNPDSRQYLFSANFHDATSNRAKKLRSTRVLELVQSLHESYRNFRSDHEWRKVTLSDFWDEKERSRCRRTTRDFGRQTLKSEPGGDGLN